MADPLVETGRTLHGRLCMNEVVQLVVFRLDAYRYALPLTAVERIVRAVEVTPVPMAPPSVLGAINVQGRVLPVLSLRRRFRLPDCEIAPAHWFLIARTARRTVVLVVDEAHGVVERLAADIVASAQISPGLEAFPGVVALDDALVLIQDLDTFLSPAEERVLDDAMSHLAEP